MFGTLKMMIKRFVVFASCLCVMLVFGVHINVQAATLGIDQSISASTAKSGDEVRLSVSLRGGDGSIDVTQISGVLEYDTNLFTMKQIVGNGLSTAKINASSGSFMLANGLGKTLSSGDLICTIILSVNSKATTGTTTLCINSVTLTDSMGETSTVANYSPSSIRLLGASAVGTSTDAAESKEDKVEETTEDSNQETTVDDDEAIDVDGEDEDFEEESDDLDDDEEFDADGDGDEEDEDFEEESDDEIITSSHYHGSSSNKSNTSKKKASVTSVKNRTNTTPKKSKVDASYKTGAGFGNDIYLVVAMAMGLSGIGAFFYRRKWMKDRNIF